MSGSWAKVRLGELLEITSSKRIFRSDYVSGGVPFFRSKEVIERASGSDISTELFISRNKFEEIKNRFGAPEAGDILLTSVGTLGVSYRVQAGDEFYFKDGNLTWFRNFSDRVDGGYLLLWLRSNLAKTAFDQITIGSTQKALTIVALKGIEVNLPDVSEQVRIAEVLSPLDEKIELNRKQNRTLEAIAQALFKRWFVEFEFPDENGNPYKSSGGAMQPSELGEIPEGWEIICLGDVVSNKKETADPSSIPGDTPYVGLEHIGRHTLGLSDWGTADDVASNKSRFAAGNVLFGKLRPYFHKVAIAPHDGICSTDVLVFQEKSPEYFSFMVMLVFSEAFVSYSNNASTGTRMPRANWKHMKEYPLAAPPINVFNSFNKAVEPSLLKIQENLAESLILANLRDILLPKLMSGKLRVA